MTDRRNIRWIDVVSSTTHYLFTSLVSFLLVLTFFHLLPRTIHPISYSDCFWQSLCRYGAGGNASAHSATIMSARKLEEADDVGKIAKVNKSLSKAIMQARTAKKMTQKELATAINEKPQVVAEYESGKAVPNPQIISKLERKLGTKLPRPGKSKAPAKAAGAKGSTGGVKKTGGVTRGGPPKRR